MTAMPTSPPSVANASAPGTSSLAKLSKKRSIPDGLKWMSIRAGPSPWFCQVWGRPRGMKTNEPTGPVSSSSPSLKRT